MAVRVHSVERLDARSPSPGVYAKDWVAEPLLTPDRERSPRGWFLRSPPRGNSRPPNARDGPAGREGSDSEGLPRAWTPPPGLQSETDNKPGPLGEMLAHSPGVWASSRRTLRPRGPPHCRQKRKIPLLRML